MVNVLTVFHYLKPYILCINGLICLLFMPLNSLAETDDQVKKRLMTMSSEAEKASYRGTVVISNGKKLETLNVLRKVANGEVQERVVYLNGEHREIRRKGKIMTCLLPKRGAMRFDTSSAENGQFSLDYATRFNKLLGYYHIKNAGYSRIAGRQAVLIDLVPKDNFRYGYQLALDKDKNILLRSSLRSEKHGRVLEQFEFTAIDFDVEISDSELAPPLTENQRLASSKAKDDVTARKINKANIENWQVHWVPDGFNSSAKKALNFTDGLSSFTVFIAQNVNLGDRYEQRGATTAFTKVVSDQVGIYSITVVGEIPRIAAEKVAASVARR